MKYIYGLFIVFISLLFSCNPNNEIENNLKIIHSKKINLPLNRLVKFTKSNCGEQISYGIKYKLIVYFDSIYCSECEFKRLMDWNEILIMKDSVKLESFFIISNKDLEGMRKMYRKCNFNEPIYVDTCNCFINENKQIPSKRMYHTLLLDEKDSVLYVGNPLYGEKNYQLFIGNLR